METIYAVTSQKLKLYLKGRYFDMWKRSSRNGRCCLTCVQSGTSMEHSEHGRRTGINESLHKRTTLKGMVARFKSVMVFAFLLVQYLKFLITFYMWISKRTRLERKSGSC